MAIRIGQDNYDVIKEWLENIASKYFDINLKTNVTKNGTVVSVNNPELSLLKTGFFGFTNEVMASSVKNASYHRSMLFRELSLNTASIPENIYNFAKLYNYDIPMATPAEMRVKISIEKSSLIKNSTYSNDMKKYVLNLATNDTFLVESFTYRLINNIVIYASNKLDNYKGIDISENIKKIQTDFSNNFIYEVYYIDKDSNFKPLVVLDVDNYIVFEASLEQTEITEKTILIDSSLAGKPINIPVQTDNDICRFEVYYKQEGDFRKINTYFNNFFTPSNSEEYAYYSYFNSKHLLVYFPSNLDQFKPQILSEIKVKVFHTKNMEANFTFDNQLTFSPESNIKLVTSITPSSESSGGNSTLSLKEIKNNIMNIILERNNLITESDLQKYFNKEITKKFKYSTAKFIRKQDDILARIFDSFILMKNKSSLIIPTNTIDIVYEEPDYFGARNIRFDPSENFITEEFIYNYGEDDLVESMTLTGDHVFVDAGLAQERMYPEYTINPDIKPQSSYTNNNIGTLEALFNKEISPYEKSPAFRLPFLIDIQFKRNLITTKMDEILTMKNIHLNISEGMVLHKINSNINLNVNVSNIEIQRNFLTTDDDSEIDPSKIIYVSTFIKTLGMGNLETSLLDIRLVLRDTTKVYAYTKMVEDSSIKGKYKAQFYTLDEYDDNGKILLYNVINCEDFNVRECYVPKDIIPEIVVGINYEKYNESNLMEVFNGVPFKNLFNLAPDSFYNAFSSFIPTSHKSYISLYTDMTSICPLGIKHYLDYTESGLVMKRTSSNGRTDIVTFYKNGIPSTEIDSNEIVRILGKEVRLIYNENVTYTIYNTDFTSSLDLFNYVEYPDGISVHRKNKVKKIKITGVPVVGFKYLNPSNLDINNYSHFYDTFNSYISLLKENFEKLENNTSFNLKLYNTYGRSKFFNTKNINLMLKLKIKLKVAFSSSLDFSIKLFIMRFIEGINTKTVFPISNLITSLENSFSEIDYMIYEDDDNCFGYAIQNYNVQSNLILTNTEKYVPEYLNVELESDDFNTDLNSAILKSGIKITYL